MFAVNAFGSEDVRVWGAEDSAAYVEDLRLFREVLSKSKEVEEFLKPMEEDLRVRAKRILGPEFRIWTRSRGFMRRGK